MAGEVVVADKVSVGDDENEEGGVVWEICDKGRGRGEEGGK